MALPGLNAVSVAKVEVDEPLVGIPPLSDAPAITSPDDNEAVKVAWNETLYTKNIAFAWNASDGADTYEMEISEDSKFPAMSTLLISGIESTSKNLLAYYLPINKTLYVRVRGIAEDGFSASPWSEVIAFSVTKEQLKEGLERVELTTNSGTEKQYFQAIRDPEDGKKNVTIKGLMKLKVAVNENDEPTTYTNFLKNGDIWYDETDEEPS
jgi:hypothetical protein